MGIKEYIKRHKKLSRKAFNLYFSVAALKQRMRYAKFTRRIREFKDIHKGKRCFIIGTGPSLTVSDLELLKNEITFATNRIYELFSRTDWRPTYYVNQDHNLIRTFGDLISDVNARNVFLPVEYVENFRGDRYRFFVLKHNEFYPNRAPFSFDPSKYIAQGFTVTYGAIQLAIYMGFTEIYLLGIDHNYSITRDAQGKPVRSSTIENNYSEGIKEYINLQNLPRVEETTVAFETAQEIASSMSVCIYNCTRGGKLEAFERKKLEDVLEV